MSNRKENEPSTVLDEGKGLFPEKVILGVGSGDWREEERYLSVLYMGKGHVCNFKS